MPTPGPSAKPQPSAARFDPKVEDVHWAMEGVLSGLLGATTIAGFLLLLDVAAGRPFLTPNALGAVVFTGGVPALDEPMQPGLILGYSVLHTAVFIIVGLVAAFELFTGTRIPGRGPWVRSLVLASLLFLLFEIGSFVFAGLVEPAVQQVVGFWRVSVANLLAAAAMSILLRARGERLGLHPDAPP